MTTLREAAQQALEALELDAYGEPPRYERNAAITALRAALAEPVQEPVAWMCSDPDLAEKGYSRFSSRCESAWNIPVYTAPPQRKPLTQEKIWHIYKNLWMFHPAEEPRLAGDVLKFARAIERAHGINDE